jgi:hypothetical protein
VFDHSLDLIAFFEQPMNPSLSIQNDHQTLKARYSHSVISCRTEEREYKPKMDELSWQLDPPQLESLLAR